MYETRDGVVVKGSQTLPAEMHPAIFADHVSASSVLLCQSLAKWAFFDVEFLHHLGPGFLAVFLVLFACSALVLGVAGHADLRAAVGARDWSGFGLALVDVAAGWSRTVSEEFRVLVDVLPEG